MKTSHWAPKAQGEVLSEPNVDLYEPRTCRSILFTEVEKEWLLTICLADSVFGKGNVINIQAYIPSRFAVQIGFSQGLIGSLGYMRRRYGRLQDANNAWEFAIALNTKAYFGYLSIVKRTVIPRSLLNGMPRTTWLSRWWNATWGHMWEFTRRRVSWSKLALLNIFLISSVKGGDSGLLA